MHAIAIVFLLLASPAFAEPGKCTDGVGNIADFQAARDREYAKLNSLPKDTSNADQDVQYKIYWRALMEFKQCVH